MYLFSFNLSAVIIFWSDIPYRPAFIVQSLFYFSVLSDFFFFILCEITPKHGVHASVNHCVHVCVCVLSLYWCESEGASVQPVEKLAIVWQCDHSYVYIHQSDSTQHKFRDASVGVYGILAQHAKVFWGLFLIVHPLDIRLNFVSHSNIVFLFLFFHRKLLE